MITLNTFLLGLLIVSVLTGLVTEAIKNLLVEHEKKYMSNTLAGIVSIVLSLAIGIAYFIMTGTNTTAQMVVYMIALILLSWLSAMVGYDKVIQSISQFKSYSKEE